MSVELATELETQKAIVRMKRELGQTGTKSFREAVRKLQKIKEKFQNNMRRWLVQ
jgi:hypothetical protein